MKVILLQDVDNLGDKDEIKDVAGGYARNYLLPRGFAVIADKTALKDLDRRLHFAERKEKKLEAKMVKAVDRIKGSEIEIVVHAGKEGRLYGSVLPKQIAAALSEKFEWAIDKKRVKLQEPIKQIGDYVVPVQLREDTIADITVHVVSDQVDEPEEAEEEKAADTQEAAAEGEQAEAPAAAEDEAPEETTDTAETASDGEAEEQPEPEADEEPAAEEASETEESSEQDSEEDKE